MRVEINPSLGKGIYSAPPSKSMTHRYLIAAGLAHGTSRLDHIIYSDDIKATLCGLKALGIRMNLSSESVEIEGGLQEGDSKKIDCRDSGSTLRFLLPLALIQSRPITFFGSERLFSRPLTVYEDICRENELTYIQDKQSVTVRGPLHGGCFQIPGNISSQFISGLLFSLPLLKEDSLISILPPIESRPYIDMTLAVLNAFGIKTGRIGKGMISIPGNQRYCAQNCRIEGDYSNSAVFIGLKHFGNDIRIKGLEENSLQGDKMAEKYFLMLNESEQVIDLSQCPDLGPVLFAYASVKNGGSFVNIQRLRIKESDRIAGMISELKKFGIRCSADDHSFTIEKNQHIVRPTEVLNGHNDHRIVMALSMLLTLTGGMIDNAEAVNKSYPEFFTDMKKLGFDVRSLVET